MLEIDDKTPFPASRMVASKYDEVFAKLRPGQSIKCEAGSSPTNRIAGALRKWLQNRGRDDVVVRIVSKMPDGYGRVFLLPKKSVRMADVPARRVSKLGMGG